ncbi:carbohydrate porin [Asaia prunellae]|uniref:carbohydrate porin n=1 Tax=Asaia prunellae TaxID=610245 RepID=UPI000470D3C6|nr:carbohydrate porin [Asaia prunellae]
MGGYAHNQPSVSTYGDEHYVGLLDRGFIRSRPGDTIGILYANVAVTGALNETQRLQLKNHRPFSNGATGVQKSETVFSLFYDMHVMTGLNLAPDFQYIIHPNAQRNIRDAVVFGFRTRISL